MKLFYTKPARQWEESLPIGNGSLGAMIRGGVKKEQLGLNEESIWSGYYKDKNNYQAYKSLNKVRELILEERYHEAEKLVQNKMLGEYNESYLPLGDLYFEFDHSDKVSNYQRILDIENSLAKVTYKIGSSNYQREYFASYPAQAVFIKFSCDKSLLNFSLSLKSQLKYHCEYSEKSIIIKGKCPEHVDPNYINNPKPIVQGDKGMEFEGRVRILSCDGSINVNGNSLSFKDVSKVIVAFSAVKESKYDSRMSYQKLKKIHIEDYKNLYDRVELYLGKDNQLPTDERLEKLRKGEKDNSLFALYFQYGRYLLISSSRKGSLPANLQGIWSWDIRPPWSSNWTTNINVEMNYWPAQTCNLQECLEPYFEFVEKICREGKKTAKAYYNCRGFTHHHNSDYWCNTNPVGLVYGEEKGHNGVATWSMWPMGGAWLVSEFFKHYEYNLDKDFLRKRTYPILREAALFLIDWLFEHEGEYNTCPSTSPENKFKTGDGVSSSVAMSSTMDLTLIREVFEHFQRTCQILEIDDCIMEDISERLEKLAPFKIGSQGQLLEWHKEFEECEPGHRHISHLYGLFPGELFSDNEDLIDAARISLMKRLEAGGGHTGWSCAWIINVFAILKDNENAYKYLKTLLTRSSYDNLWDAHPPFQIDGNFGGIAGIANMLVQDRNGEVKLLPALPDEFESGYVKGLRIKNGKAVDIIWKNGKVEEYRVY